MVQCLAGAVQLQAASLNISCLRPQAVLVQPGWVLPEAEAAAASDAHKVALPKHFKFTPAICSRIC